MHIAGRQFAKPVEVDARWGRNQPSAALAIFAHGSKHSVTFRRFACKQIETFTGETKCQCQQ
jgi:hypothetical protein